MSHTNIHIEVSGKKNEIIFRVFLIKPLRSQRDSQFVLANSAFKHCSEMLFCKKKKAYFFPGFFPLATEGRARLSGVCKGTEKRGH